MFQGYYPILCYIYEYNRRKPRMPQAQKCMPPRRPHVHHNSSPAHARKARPAHTQPPQSASALHLCLAARRLPLLTHYRTHSFLTSDANKRAKSLLDRLDHVSAAGCALLPHARALPRSLTKVDRATDKKDRVAFTGCAALSS